MKKYLLLPGGLIFFPLGYWVNDLILSETMAPSLFLPMGLGVLVLWFFWGMVGNFLLSDKKQARKWSHVIPLCILLLVLFQEFILHRYWRGALGILGQMYFLPLMRLSAVLWPFSGALGWLYTTAFLLLWGSYYLGQNLGPQPKIAA